LEALAVNELAAESDLTIFCDGPRTEKEMVKTNAVRDIARTTSGFFSVAVVYRENNWGLAKNITNGVTDIIAAYGRVIVLEDDLVTSPYFLRYMNIGLDLYADDPQVASIHGWCFPHTVENPPETFFLRGADCLGWATWKRAWALFEPNPEILRAELRQRKLTHAFNCNNSYDYMGMLRAHRGGVLISWAVRWRATAFIHDMYTLHPGRSLVQHIGGDGHGTNVGTTDLLDVVLTDRPILVEKQTPQEDAAMRQADMAFHSKFKASPSCWRTIKHGIRTLLPFLPSRQECKNLLKDCLSPIVLRFLQRRHIQENTVRREGDYPDWPSAVAASCGYILRIIRQFLRKVERML